MGWDRSGLEKSGKSDSLPTALALPCLVVVRCAALHLFQTSPLIVNTPLIQDGLASPLLGQTCACSASAGHPQSSALHRVAIHSSLRRLLQPLTPTITAPVTPSPARPQYLDRVCADLQTRPQTRRHTPDTSAIRSSDSCHVCGKRAIALEIVIYHESEPHAVWANAHAASAAA